MSSFHTLFLLSWSDPVLLSHQAGARFAKWRSVVSVAAGPSQIALRDCAYGLARYAAIAQVGAGPRQ